MASRREEKRVRREGHDPVMGAILKASRAPQPCFLCGGEPNFAGVLQAPPGHAHGGGGRAIVYWLCNGCNEDPFACYRVADAFEARTKVESKRGFDSIQIPSFLEPRERVGESDEVVSTSED